MQESTKEPLHGVNGGIRLRSFAERARKTYAVPNFGTAFAAHTSKISSRSVSCSHSNRRNVCSAKYKKKENAERARKTYAVPNTRSGRSLPRRTKPRHFHECRTKPYRHSDYLPVILWSPLPSVILPPSVILRRSQDRRRIAFFVVSWRVIRAIGR